MNNRDKWIIENGYESDNEKYYQLGIESFHKDPKKEDYEASKNLWKTSEFQYEDRTPEKGLRAENWYQQWRKGFNDAYDKYYRVNEFNERLQSLMDEFNMDVDEDGNYYPKKSE